MNESVPQLDWREEVRQKMEQAEATALSVEKTKEKIEKNERLALMLDKGEITDIEYSNQRDSGCEGLAVFKTLSEFTEALKYLNLTTEKISEILAHENEHRRVAEQGGAEAVYSLLIGGDRTHGGIYLPSVKVYLNYSNAQKSKESIEFSKKIAAAPDNLSESDKKLSTLE